MSRLPVCELDESQKVWTKKVSCDEQSTKNTQTGEDNQQYFQNQAQEQ